MPEGVVSLNTLIVGYEQAARRFLDVRNSQSPVTTFLPLFEALSWSVAIDSRFQERWKQCPTNPAEWWSDGFINGNTVKGMRFARHRVHHQWADALEATSGAVFPITFPMSFMEWRWRRTLPSGRDDTHKAQYEQHVANHPARHTLQEISDCFRDAYKALATPDEDSESGSDSLE